MLTTIYFIRHGETDWNKNKRIQGQTGISKLTEEGKRQSLKAKEEMKNIKIDKIYSSPLKRTLETAKIIFPNKKIIFKKGLAERSYGEWEKRFWKDLEKESPEKVNAYNQHRSLEGVKGAESLEELQKRALKTLDEILDESEGKTIAIVSHGQLIKSLLSKIKQIGMEESATTKMEKASVIKIEIPENKTF